MFVWDEPYSEGDCAMSRRLAIVGMLFVFALSLENTPAAPPRPARETDAYRLLREKKFVEATDAFAAIVRDNPFDGDVQAAYGQALHGVGRDDEAIRAMQASAELGSAPSANFYNVACVLAVRGDREQAIPWLRKALDAGFAEQPTLETDTDMDSLRS